MIFGWIADWLSRRAADRRQQEEILRAVQAAAARRARALADPGASPVERLLRWWDRAPAPAGSNAEALHALEQRYAIALPDDFRRYLEAAMPEGNAWDDEGTRWFALTEIKSVREECPEWDTDSALDSDALLVFADYLVWCYAWAVDCSDTENRGKVALITGEDHYIAASFDEFLDRYLRDDRDLHC